MEVEFVGISFTMDLGHDVFVVVIPAQTNNNLFKQFQLLTENLPGNIFSN